MRTLNLSRDSQKVLRQLHKNAPKHAGQIAQKIIDLQHDPEQQDSKTLKGDLKAYRRVDVGSYRIVYWTEPDTVYVVLIGKRNDADVYRQLRRRR